MRSGLDSWCNPCRAARTKQWRHENAATIAAYNESRRKPRGVVACKCCGERFEQRRCTQTKCDKCKRSHKRPNRASSCPVCGERFVLGRHDQVYCGRVCSAIVARGGRGESCPVPDRAECGHCRKWFYVSGLFRKWCSDECRTAASKNTAPPFSCVVCDKACIPGEDGLHWQAHKFCSDDCRRTEHRRRHLGSESRKEARDRRRARAKNAYRSRVVRRDIYERDDWTCQLCGVPVNPGASVPDYWAPTIDHVIPLSRGGTHEPDNVQCAHFICNSRKGDRV